MFIFRNNACLNKTFSTLIHSTSVICYVTYSISFANFFFKTEWLRDNALFNSLNFF